MTHIRRTAIATALFLSVCASAAAQPPDRPKLTAADKRLTPEQVALVDEGDKGVVLRHFPSSLRLYTFDQDAPGRSNCNLGCASRWPPVLAPADATDIQEFTVVTRDDGRKQWAFRGKPLYMRYHDAPNMPSGDGEEGGAWHVVPHTPPVAAAR